MLVLANFKLYFVFNYFSRLCLQVDRDDLITSSYKATRWLTEADWAKTFNITFNREYGYDYGGLSREWFEILTRKMFHPDQGLFVQVEDESEAVFPNPNPGPDVKMKMYKFAGG